jgi:hypothetical protein
MNSNCERPASSNSLKATVISALLYDQHISLCFSSHTHTGDPVFLRFVGARDFYCTPHPPVMTRSTIPDAQFSLGLKLSPRKCEANVHRKYEITYVWLGPGMG